MRSYVIAGLVIISTFCGISAQSTTEKQQNNLDSKYGPVIFLNLLWRHGDRTIITSYPKDPHNASSIWNIGYGELTKKGEWRHFRLGGWIKARYPNLVGKRYSRDDLYVMSSDSDRCLMSAQSNLAGMYPGNANDKPPFQPIPIHSVPRETDNMIYMDAACPKYNLEEKNLKASDYMKNMDEKLLPLYNNLTKFTGTCINDIDGVRKIYDTLKVEHEDLNMDLPEWAKSIFPDVLREVSLDAFKARTYTETMKKLKAGPLLTDMLGHLVLKANGTLVPDRKIWIYSGHDETIVALLRALNLHDQADIGLPTYASLVAMELRKKDKDHFVTIFYKDGGKDDAVELIPANCKDGRCTLETFLEMTKNMTVLNWKEECVVGPDAYHTMSDIKMDATELFAATFLIMCLLLIFCYCRRRPVITTHYHKLQNQLE